MPLYWLFYRHNNQIVVVIEPGASLIHGGLRLMDCTKASSRTDDPKWRTAEWNEFR
jgi:hypothetical protein